MIIIFFISGLIIGSFLNAVIYRLDSGDSIINDRSKCIKCGHRLAFFDLVPILSFILLRGRCRYCRKPISWQYPLVELATGLIFVWYFFVFGLSSTLFFFLFFASLFLVVAIFDFFHYLILDKVVITGLIASLVYRFLTQDWMSAILAAGVAAGFFGLQYLFSNGRWIGLGDVKLGLLLGFAVGYPNIIALLLLAYFMGGLVGIFLLTFGKKELSSKLPFGTFLGISAIIILPYANEIIAWYRDLINL